jgi:hypothetical protein
LIALIINMALRSMIVTDAILETGSGVVTMAEIINFVISGFVAYFCWQRNLSRLIRKKIQSPFS